MRIIILKSILYLIGILAASGLYYVGTDEETLDDVLDIIIFLPEEPEEEESDDGLIIIS